MSVFDQPSRILAYRAPVDMRKSFDGLLAVVKSVLHEDPLSGTWFVFINRRRNYIKAVYWDRTGFCLFAKRLERGRFAFRSEAVDVEDEVQSSTTHLLMEAARLSDEAGRDL